MESNLSRSAAGARSARRAGSRRGSVIVLAVGVLAALAIIAISYTVAVRSDRRSAQTHAAQIIVSGQAEIVASEIGGLLTADLFGGKVLPEWTPRYVDSNFQPVAASAAGAVRVWPTMFEDGEFTDYPWVDVDPGTHTFITSRPGQAFFGNPGAIFFSSPPGPTTAPKQDDPWLASSEPVASTGAQNDPWDTWPQITNLRCAYRLTKNPSNPTQWFWVRDDGRYADLGRFFTRADGSFLSRPDPTANLSDFVDERVFAGSTPSGPELGRDQRVFDFQINGMGNNTAAGGLPAERYGSGPAAYPNPMRPFPLEPIDERYWADTDGDLRPDARWQVLDALGTLGGLRWVVAARIIDNSGQINVNTALDAGLNDLPAGGQFDSFAYTPPANAPTWTLAMLQGGHTPADVDLFRLVSSGDRSAVDEITASAWSNGPQPGARDLVRTDLFDPLTGNPARIAFREHLDGAMRLSDLANEIALVNTGATQPTYQSPHTSDSTWRFTSAERDAIYREFGVSPSDRQSFARAYAIEDEIELKTYWGVNNDAALSSIETRMDYGYRPGESRTNNSTPGGLVTAVGPMRSANPTMNERSFQFIGSGANAPPRPTTFDLRDDVRRHLTTYSGAADFSPVPALNRAIESGSPAFGDRAFNRKVRLSEFPVNTQGAGPVQQALEVSKFEQIRRAYESFAWALAPLATGSSVNDQPLMAPLTVADLAAIHNGANGQDFHYGGGPNSPAEAIKAANGGQDMGAAYAILRAASLAVNLADAMDAENPGAAISDETLEGPTVARFFNQPISGANLVQPTGPVVDTPGVVELGTRFSHGDVPTGAASMPPTYVGQPANGVTLIGLDRQPFLRSASFFAVYENVGAQGQAMDPTGMPPVPQDVPLEINTDDPGQQVGSIFAVELHNPWPNPVDAEGYRVAMATDLGWYEFVIDSNAAGGAILLPGETVAFYASMTSGSGQAAWDPVEDEWEATAPLNGSGAPTPRRVDSTLITMRDVSTGAIQAGPYDPVPFHAFATAAARPTSILLFAPGSTAPLLVDRMSTPAPTEFPFTHTGNVSVPKPPGIAPGQHWEGRIAAAGSIRRTNDTPTPENAGFPACVIERRADNTPDAYTAPLARGWYSHWISPTGTPPPVEDLIGGASQVGFSDLKTHIGEVEAAPPYMPSVQLFVPNKRLNSPGELGMLCAYTHIYVHNGAGAMTLLDVVAAADPTLTGPGSWQTIGEQLGHDAHIKYNTASGSPADATNRNPALGTLDFSRFTLSNMAPLAPPQGIGTLGGAAGLVNLPDALAVPLAARVFDCFEALDIPMGLAQGRVNVNTAPVRALRSLPWMSPWYEVKNNSAASAGFPFDGELSDASGAAGPMAVSLDRAFALADYRDAGFDGLLPGASRFNLLSQALDSNSREGQTHLTGLRGVGERPGSAVARPGISTLGEMALLSRWNTDWNGMFSGGDVSAFIGGANAYVPFAEAGMANPSDGTRKNSGVSTGLAAIAANVAAVDKILDVWPSAVGALSASARSYDPVDDNEERLTVFRPLANVATTRSDVFTAWFIVRGYDPRQIAAISIPPGNDEARMRGAMSQLKPIHESRWLAVFDRSNVRTPLDKPRLLALTELPLR